jgi:hypothetical protein
MVSQARKQALLDAFEYRKALFQNEDAILIGWHFYRKRNRYSLWLRRNGTFEANRRAIIYDHRSLGRLLSEKLPPQEIARACAFRMGI